MPYILENENDTDHEHPSIPRLPAIPKINPRRTLEFADLSRTFVVLGNKHRPITDLFLAEFLAVLRYADCDASTYRENEIRRDWKRLKYINALIEAGGLEVIQGLSPHRLRLFLVAARKTLTCTQLAGMDRWEIGLCCAECHRIGAVYTVGLSGHRCQGELCCRAAMILDDWPRIALPLPEHADEW